MTGTSTPRPRELAHHLRDGGRGLLRVDGDPDELRAGVGEAGDLDRGRVGVGRVRVRHRLDDDRVGAADEHAADVDADGRPAPRAEGVGRGHRPSARQEPPHRIRTMSKPLTQIRNAKRNAKPTTYVSRSARRLIRAPKTDFRTIISIRPPSSGGKGRMLTRARFADRTRRDVERQDRARRRRRCRRSGSRCRSGRRPAAPPSGCRRSLPTRSPSPARISPNQWVVCCAADPDRGGQVPAVVAVEHRREAVRAAADAERALRRPAGGVARRGVDLGPAAERDRDRLERSVRPLDRERDRLADVLLEVVEGVPVAEELVLVAVDREDRVARPEPGRRRGRAGLDLEEPDADERRREPGDQGEDQERGQRGSSRRPRRG